MFLYLGLGLILWMGYKITNEWIYNIHVHVVWMGIVFELQIYEWVWWRSLWMGFSKLKWNHQIQFYLDIYNSNHFIQRYKKHLKSFKSTILSCLLLQKSNLIQQFNVTVVVNSIPYLKQNRSKHVYIPRITNQAWVWSSCGHGYMKTRIYYYDLNEEKKYRTVTIKKCQKHKSLY